MDREEYLRLHAEERRELAELDITERNAFRNYSFECERYEDYSSVIANSFAVARDVTKKPRRLLRGVILSAIFGAALGYFLLGVYNLGRNNEREKMIEELNSLQERKRIETFIRKELEDMANTERDRYYLNRRLESRK